MFNQPIYGKCLLVVKRQDRALVGTAEGTESVVGHLSSSGMYQLLVRGKAVVNHVKRRAFTAREVADQFRLVNAKGTW